MAIRGQGLVGEDGEGNSEAAEKTVYVLHPNCAVDDYQKIYVVDYTNDERENGLVWRAGWMDTIAVLGAPGVILLEFCVSSCLQPSI